MKEEKVIISEMNNSEASDNFSETIRVLKEIGKSQGLQIIKFSTRDDLEIDEIIINILIIPKTNHRGVNLNVSSKLKDQEFIARRIRNCIFFWIPFCSTFSRKINQEYSIKINAGDYGKANVISMDFGNYDYLIPDEYAMNEYLNLRKNQLKIKRKKDFYDEWQEKENILFWRGSTSGHNGNLSSINELMNLERIKQCLAFKKFSFSDIKISKVVQIDFEANLAEETLKKLGVFANYVSKETFNKYKSFPSLKGNSEAWGTLSRHLGGSLVFRSTSISKLLYYKYMIPWTHFIPIKKDFSDLVNKYKWAESHREESTLIAWKGYLLAYEYIKRIPDLFMESISKKIYSQNKKQQKLKYLLN